MTVESLEFHHSLGLFHVQKFAQDETRTSQDNQCLNMVLNHYYFYYYDPRYSIESQFKLVNIGLLAMYMCIIPHMRITPWALDAWLEFLLNIFEGSLYLIYNNNKAFYLKQILVIALFLEKSFEIRNFHNFFIVAALACLHLHTLARILPLRIYPQLLLVNKTVGLMKWKLMANSIVASLANTVGAAESVLRVAATGHDKKLFFKVVSTLYFLAALGRVVSGAAVAYA
ncbi:hypothetical protein ACJX0J_039864, partial [Zea mays]